MCLSQSLRDRLKVAPEQTGVVVTKVSPIAAKAGLQLQEDDVIIAIDHKKVGDDFTGLCLCLCLCLSLSLSVSNWPSSPSLPACLPPPPFPFFCLSLCAPAGEGFQLQLLGAAR